VHSGVQHILCFGFVLFFFVLSTLCCQFLWIVHFWLPFRYSLKFIDIEYGRRVTVAVNFDRNVRKWGRSSCFCCFFYRMFFEKYYWKLLVINWQNIHKCEIKGFRICHFLSLMRVFINSVVWVGIEEHIIKEKGTACSMEMPVSWWKMLKQIYD
jgi:hypothetical protein